MRLFVIIVLSIVVAVALIRGIQGFTGADRAASAPAPQYEVVPCSEVPDAIGCPVPDAGAYP